MKDAIKRFTQKMVYVKYDFDDFDLEEYSANFQKKLDAERHNKRAKKLRLIFITISIVAILILSVIIISALL